jgi:hypothetical protein
MGSIQGCTRPGELMSKLDRSLTVVDLMIVGAWAYFAATSEGWFSIVMGVLAGTQLLMVVIRLFRHFRQTSKEKHLKP